MLTFLIVNGVLTPVVFVFVELIQPRMISWVAGKKTLTFPI